MFCFISVLVNAFFGTTMCELLWLKAMLVRPSLASTTNSPPAYLPVDRYTSHVSVHSSRSVRGLALCWHDTVASLRNWYPDDHGGVLHRDCARRWWSRPCHIRKAKTSKASCVMVCHTDVHACIGFKTPAPLEQH